VSAAHVQRLMETGGTWPPLLVQRRRLMVIDGAHRLAAARALGLTKVAAVFFEGSDDEARIEAIRCNKDHGLPVTLPDRKQAASDMITRHPDWSDGRVAEICSLSPKTVAALRRVDEPDQAGCAAPVEMDRRLGRDGKRHPIGPRPVRDRVAQALADDPGASLRTIAARVGVSPETVRTVRRANFTPAPVADPPSDRLPTIDPELLGTGAGRNTWSRDGALTSTEDGARFASWFDRFDVDEAALWEHPRAVPKSRTYLVIDEARRRARFWADFADRVEGRQLSRRT
jgi:ParB-like nuclease domain